LGDELALVVGFPHGRRVRMWDESQFSVVTAPTRDGVTVVVSGQVDLSTAPSLKAELDELWSRGFDRIVVDLRPVIFIDSTGLGLLISQRKAATAAGHAFEVLCQEGQVQWLLRITGLEDYLTSADGVLA
jgi:anti-sigma B factor antagonist